MKKTTLLVGALTLFMAQNSFAEKYTLDTAHTIIGFGVRHVGISMVRGTFRKFDGSVEYDAKKPDATKIDVDIDPSSIDTGNEKRDGHVKSPDFLDVKKFPKMKYVSTSVKADGKTGFTVNGNLTLHGVTKPVTLKVTDFVAGKNAMDKKDHVGGSATGVVNRQDFGIKWNGSGMTGVAGEAAVGDEVKLQFDFDAVTK